jgi:hypothetical protein
VDFNCPPPAQQLPGRLREIARVGRLEPLPRDTIFGLAERFPALRPTVLGEAVIGLGVAIFARDRLHYPGGRQLAERLKRAVGDPHAIAFEAETEHGDGRFGQGECLGHGDPP